MRRAFVSLAAAAALAAVLPSHAAAQGFQLDEHGTCVMGRAGTGVSSPCQDGSAIFFNPAGITALSGWTLSAGVLVIDAFGDFTADFTGEKTDLANSPIPVPHVYGVYGVTDRVSAGLGVFVPYGLGTTWPIVAGQPAGFEGRFNSYDSDLRSIYIQPTVAVKLNEYISIGAGFDLVISSVELNQRVDVSGFPLPGTTVTFAELGVPFHTDFADAEIRATGTGAGANFGVWVQPVPRVSFGLRYLTRVTVDYDGDAAFDPIPTNLILPVENPICLNLPGCDPALPLPLDSVLAFGDLFGANGPLADQGGSTSITMPDQFTVGVAVDVMPGLKLLGEWQWVNWSEFDVLVLDFESPVTPDITLESLSS